MQRRQRLMWQRLFNLAAAVSLLLCAATVVLWMRSYVGAEQWARKRRLPHTSLREDYFIQDNGRLIWSHYDNSNPEPRNAGPEAVRWDYRRDIPTAVVELGHFGFYFHSGISYPGANWRDLMIPHWSLVVLFAVLPFAAVLTPFCGRRAGKHGVCSACGYDLRATPDRCPECGTVVSLVTAGRP